MTEEEFRDELTKRGYRDIGIEVLNEGREIILECSKQEDFLRHPIRGIGAYDTKFRYILDNLDRLDDRRRKG